MAEHSSAVPTRTALVVTQDADAVTDLVDLTCDLIGDDDCQIIVLSVLLGAVETEEAAIVAIEERVKHLAEEKQLPVRLMTVSSTSVARGVLDTAREERVDLIVVGTSAEANTAQTIGSVAENIAAATPCRLVIYRRGVDSDLRRVVITAPVDNPAEETIRVGVDLAFRRAQPATLLTVGPDALNGETRLQLRNWLTEIKVDPAMEREHVDARDPVGAIFARIDKHDLLVTGYKGNNGNGSDNDDGWFYTQGATALLRDADGPVALVVGSTSSETVRKAPSQLSKALIWLRPVLTPAEQRELVARSEQMAGPTFDYLVLTIISALLASFGLLASSNAVIIGAMLVAPLMSPLVAFAVSGVTGRFRSIKQASNALFQGFVISFVVAAIVGYLSRSQLVTPEMAARGNPTLVDLGVALAAGTVAAYANARKDIPAALAGVAIAAALMPPICTVGLSFAMGDIPLFQGSLLLFAVNISSIVIAAWLTFFYLGMRPRSEDEVRHRPLAAGLIVVVFGLVLAVVISLVVTPVATARIERQLRDAFRGELVSVELRRSTPLEVIATLRRDADNPLSDARVQQVEQELAAEIDQEVQLSVVVQPLFGAPINDEE